MNFLVFTFIAIVPDQQSGYEIEIFSITHL